MAAPEAVLPAAKVPADLAWAIVQMHASERIVIDEALIAAYQRASSPTVCVRSNPTSRRLTFGVGA